MGIRKKEDEFTLQKARGTGAIRKKKHVTAQNGESQGRNKMEAQEILELSRKRISNATAMAFTKWSTE